MQEVHISSLIATAENHLSTVVTLLLITKF